MCKRFGFRAKVIKRKILAKSGFKYTQGAAALYGGGELSSYLAKRLF